MFICAQGSNKRPEHVNVFIFVKICYTCSYFIYQNDCINSRFISVVYVVIYFPMPSTIIIYGSTK